MYSKTTGGSKIVKRTVGLSTLADRANEAHGRTEEALGQAMLHAREAGDALNLAREKVAHGEWSAWLAGNCPGISLRTAQAYTKLAREWDTLTQRAKGGIDGLSLRRAMKLLAEPDEELPCRRPLTPDEIRTWIDAVGELGIEDPEKLLEIERKAMAEATDNLAIGRTLRRIRDGDVRIGHSYSEWCGRHGITPGMARGLCDMADAAPEVTLEEESAELRRLAVAA